jgi:SAM-dependent MidA family methyltransferase
MEKESRGLRQFVLSKMNAEGPIPFSRFMEWCLYHPDYGYYQSERVKIGIEGDYYSSPCVHPLFGYLVGSQLAQMAEFVGGETFSVVEMGGGRGFLCKDILDWAKKKEPTFYDRLQCYLLEKAPLAVKDQRERLSPYEKEEKVFWRDPERFEEGMHGLDGCFLSNELVDAFPVHRVIRHEGTLREIYVTQRDDQFAEDSGDLSDPRIAAYLDSFGIALEEGQKAEVNLQALDWMEQVGRWLRRGFVITIDYGYLAAELYAPHRRDGTLLCYFQHRPCQDLYERLGEQDMTSHVNFSALIQKGEEVGLQLTGLVPQYRFLLALGILQEMESVGRAMTSLGALKLRLSLKHLIEPEIGMGEVFKVLIQHKGMPRPQLDGLRDLDSVPWPP